MNLLYNFSIYIYSILIRLTAPFNQKAGQIYRGRQRVFSDLGDKINYDRPIIWVHCASLGEFEQGRPVIEAIKNQHPNYQILLTFFSPSGYEIRKNYDLADYISYLPADTKTNAKKFISLVRPEKVFFVKYEFWYYYINELKSQNIPLYLISCIFRKDQLFFKNTFYGNWYKRILFGVTHFFVQDNLSVDLLGSIGIKNVTKAGDTRFDRVAEIAKNGKTLELVEKFKGDNLLVVAGSSWKPDEDLLVQYIHKHPELKFIIAPHETKKGNVDRLITLLKTDFIKYTEATLDSVQGKQVMIVDTIGILSSIYKYADISYIGGGFGVGIHNTLEAAIFGTPIFFGPNFQKFNEAKVMVKLGIAIPVNDFISLEHSMNTLLSDSKRKLSIAQSCETFTNENIGATQLILDKVFNK